MKQATADNSLVIRELWNLNSLHRNNVYNPNCVFDVLMKSHSYFSRVDQVVMSIRRFSGDAIWLTAKSMKSLT